MSVVSKYAFGIQEAANKFVSNNSGKIMKFNELYNLVKKSQAKSFLISSNICGK